MTAHLFLGLGLLAQSAGAPPARRSDPPPVRVWLADTTLSVGDPARVYVDLRDTSHLVVLHVDPSGRIRILFPRSPTDPDLVPGGETFAVAGAEDGLTFRVPGPGLGTVVAVRARSPFRFEGLTAGNRWDYDRALLLLPTAGNPFAAVLDIADRIANGEGYNYDLAGYRTPGAVAARTAAPDSVCFGCLAARHSGSSASAQGEGGIVNSAIAIDHSYAAASGGTVVDCSDATLIDSFCGVQDNSVSTTVEETTVDQSTQVVYQVYTPLFFPLRRLRRPPRAPAPPRPAIASNLRRVPGRIVPPPPRRPPPIVVEQPRARSRPIAEPQAAAPVPPAAQAVPLVILHRAPQAASTRQAVPAAAGWTTTRSFGAVVMPRAAVPAPAAAAAQAARPATAASRPATRASPNPRR